MPVQKSIHAGKPTSKQVAKGRKYNSSKVEKYVEGLQTGKNKKQAALKAGYAPSTARNPKHIIESGIAYKSAQEKFMANMGGEDTVLELMAERLLACLKKNETRFYKDNEGTFKEFIGSKPDSRAVNGAVNHIAKLTGLYDEVQKEALVSSDDLSRLNAQQLKQLIAENLKRLHALQNNPINA